MRKIEPYRPSIRQMERFEQKWCHRCIHFGNCKANDEAAIGIIPIQWLRVDGQPTCTSYSKSSFPHYGSLHSHIFRVLASNGACTLEQVIGSFEYKHRRDHINRLLQRLELDGLVKYSASSRTYSLVEEEVA